MPQQEHSDDDDDEDEDDDDEDEDEEDDDEDLEEVGIGKHHNKARKMKKKLEGIVIEILPRAEDLESQNHLKLNPRERKNGRKSNLGLKQVFFQKNKKIKN